jgi:demethylmenaquinone methyltransferase/2-methoxy-6-polyprenyl-1,4-benzoquinol methylase
LEVSDRRDLLEEQKAYYRARAPEYDDWFLRRGPYDGGVEENQRWFEEVDSVRAALGAFDPRGEVLELACGTGWWTRELASYDAAITAVDASTEVLELNRRALGGSGRVEYELGDVFEWEPRKAFDVVFFSFWLSHVPPSRFREFWERVRGALSTDGRVFFVDSLQRSTAARMSRPAHGDVMGVEIRSLRDGREFRVVKVRYEPDRLESDLESLGWKGRVSRTERFFIYGEFMRGDSSAPTRSGP